MTDWELLGRFAREGAQDAFAELVSRHLNFVYSSARRQVRSPQLVEEVTQSVFLELAHNAAKLDARTPLTAWLYVVTRRTALNTLRTELRRQAREHTAYELTAMNSSPSAWAQVEPLLEEALDDLNPPDRSAVLLRYFENKNLREVGTALGISDDAAQKRVSRALDQLRTLLAKRGAALTAAGLATDLSAHAIEAAPLALGATISAGSFLTITAGVAAFETTQTVAMTTLQKASLASVLTLVLGAGLYEARALQLGTPSLLEARQSVASLQAESLALRQERAALARRALAARDAGRFSKLGAEAATKLDSTDSAEMTAWLARVDQLKESFATDPQAWIPEMVYLTDFDWINAARSPQDLAPENLRKTRSFLRGAAVSHFPMSSALSAYLEAHGNRPPDQVEELLPYFDPPVDPAILQRYEILPPDRRTVIIKMGTTERRFDFLAGTRNAVDLEFDDLIRYGLTGTGYARALEIAAKSATADYAKAHDGQPPTDPAQLVPYLPQPVDPAKLRPFMP